MYILENRSSMRVYDTYQVLYKQLCTVSMNKLLNQDCKHLYSDIAAALISFLFFFLLNFQEKQRRIKPMKEGKLFY